MQLIFNAKALRPPVTGIGNYTYHLLEQYLQGRYAVDDVYCFSGTHWLTGSQQLAITADIRTRRETSAARSLNGAVAEIREAIGKIPGVLSLFSFAMDRRFKSTANAIQDAVYHETNYILKPYSGPCVTTVHDLSYLRYPQYHSDYLVDWLAHGLPKSLDAGIISATG